MSQICRRVVAAPSLVLLVHKRPASGGSGFAEIKPLNDETVAVNEAETATRLRSVSGMDIHLTANPAMTLEAERELKELFGVPLSVRGMPGSKKECYRELDCDFEDE